MWRLLSKLTSTYWASHSSDLKCQNSFRAPAQVAFHTKANSFVRSTPSSYQKVRDASDKIISVSSQWFRSFYFEISVNSFSCPDISWQIVSMIFFVKFERQYHEFRFFSVEEFCHRRSDWTIDTFGLEQTDWLQAVCYVHHPHDNTHFFRNVGWVGHVVHHLFHSFVFVKRAEDPWSKWDRGNLEVRCLLLYRRRADSSKYTTQLLHLHYQIKSVLILNLRNIFSRRRSWWKGSRQKKNLEKFQNSTEEEIGVWSKNV